jgi:hypothetical protein
MRQGERLWKPRLSAAAKRRMVHPGLQGRRAALLGDRFWGQAPARDGRIWRLSGLAREPDIHYIGNTTLATGTPSVTQRRLRNESFLLRVAGGSCELWAERG